MQIITRFDAEIISDLTPTGVANMLCGATAEKDAEALDPTADPTFCGSVSEESFEITLLSRNTKNSLKPRVQGKIEAIDRGSRVTVSILPSNGFSFFILLSVLFALLFLSNLAYLIFARSIDDLGSTVTNGLVSAALYSIARITFRVHSKKTLDEIRALIG